MTRGELWIILRAASNFGRLSTLFICVAAVNQLDGRPRKATKSNTFLTSAIYTSAVLYEYLSISLHVHSFLFAFKHISTTYVDANARSVYHSISSLNEHTHTHVFILIHMCQSLAHKSSYHSLHFDTPLHVHVNLQGGTEIEGFGCIMVTTCCRCLRFHKTSRTCSRL